MSGEAEGPTVNTGVCVCVALSGSCHPDRPATHQAQLPDLKLLRLCSVLPHKESGFFSLTLRRCSEVRPAQ